MALRFSDQSEILDLKKSIGIDDASHLGANNLRDGLQKDLNPSSPITVPINKHH